MDDRSSGPSPVDPVRAFWEEVWTAGRVEVLQDIFHPDMTENGEAVDVASFQDAVVAWRKIFPDFSATVEELLTVAEDRVVTRVTYRGTHRDTLWGIEPTGNQTEAVGLDVFRVEGGRIIELWHAVDHLPLVVQIGGTVRPGPR